MPALLVINDGPWVDEAINGVILFLDDYPAVHGGLAGGTGGENHGKGSKKCWVEQLASERSINRGCSGGGSPAIDMAEDLVELHQQLTWPKWRLSTREVIFS